MGYYGSLSLININFMNADYAGKLVAKFIDKQYPNDRDAIFEILRMGVNKAWQEGKWLGMTAEFFVSIKTDYNCQKYFIAPMSHPILLAINGLNQGISIRDKYFMFHRNGYGDIRNRDGCSWSQDVYDIGSVPIIDTDGLDFTAGVNVGVRALGLVGENEFVNINGTYLDGNRVYTYESSKFGKSCGCEIKEEFVDVVNGIKLKISNDFNYISNIKFKDITSITKSLTKSPVEIIVIDAFNNGRMVARLEPNQRFSKYRKYLVPDELCGRTSLHALFKIGQQEEIVSPTDTIMISNDEALISLAKGIHNIYYKEQQEVGANYVLQGISILEKEKREEESPDEFPIQVDAYSYSDLPDALRYNS